MRGFLLRALTFVALQMLIGVAVWFGCPRQSDHYAAASIDKRQRLASAPSPRIVFVGGSSTSFGFDSRVFGDTKYTSVNMGHNRGLGLPFMVRQAAAGLRQGDLVIVSPEYELLWGEGSDRTLITHIEHDPACARYLNFETTQRLMDGGLIWLALKLRCALHNSATDPVLLFTRSSFDASGDFAAHRGKPRRPHTAALGGWPEADALNAQPAIAELNWMADRCDEVGARCVFAFAPLREERHQIAADSARRLEALIRAGSRLAVVLSIEDSLHPGSEFFDIGAHLVESAATSRTQQLRRVLLPESRR